jgi:hypothetical protein
MKKTLVLLLALLMACQINAQVAHWIIHPDYDSIYIASESGIIITDSVNKKIVWTSEGERLFKTADRLHPFNEGYAVITERNSDMILGFYDLDGNFTPIEEDCFIAHNYPFFSDGYLLVKKNGKYAFSDTKGKLHGPKGGYGIISAYPFHHGFASCRNYEKPDKPNEKEVYNFLIKPNNNKLQELSLSFNGKIFSPDDVEFISSVNDEGLGIIVAKKKVYYFKGEAELQPLCAEEGNLKKQAKLKGKLSECLTRLDKSGYVLYMSCGKSESEQISCRFDERMIPLEIGPNQNRIPFKINRTTKEEKAAPLVITEKYGLFGFAIDGVEILPPQFEAIYKCIDNEAVVKTSGKLGLLRISKDDTFHPTINRGKEICFRHRTALTTIHIDMPSYIPPKKTLINSLDTSCHIIIGTRNPKETLQGNSLEYECELDFPTLLYNYTLENPNNPKQKTIPVVYPIQIVSDGIKFPEIDVEANVWYHKSITIDIDESTKTVNNGTGTFTFDVNTERLSKDDYYRINVDIEADSSYLNPECQPFASNNSRFRGIVHNLYEGANDITIKVFEDGCPPTLIPHTITYTKPSAKNKYKKEGIVIKKKAEKEDVEEKDAQWRY